MTVILEDILAARTRIRRYIHQTPLLQSQKLSEMLGCNLYIKAEYLQKVGAFKARGVMNYLLSDTSGAEIYSTYSSGNHGQALAWGAASLKRKSIIFMPEDASPAKVAAVKGYGGEVRFAGVSSADRYNACHAYAKEVDIHIVPPFDHNWIIAGQGTAMVEIIEELPEFDAALVPCGGGGLLAGCSFVLNTLRGGKVPTYACEPAMAADLQEGLASGERKTIEFSPTIADGMRNLCVGDRNWEIIKECVPEGLACREETIVEAMRLYAIYLKNYVEPSGAATLACLMENKERFAGKTVVIVASGGNIALKDYAKMVAS